MQNALMNPQFQVPQALAEKVLLGGDLSQLTPTERLTYYNAVCNSLNLNPLTRPFEYLALNGKLTLYARKDCTDQLRREHGVSVEISSREVVDGVFVVTAQAKDMTERVDESIGAVPLPTSPLDKANAMMKAETKAKRRVTLSICGLGMLDETEIETIHGAHPIQPKLEAQDRQEDGLNAASSNAPSAADMPAPPVSQDAPAPDDLFVQGSAIADHELALDECKSSEDLQKAWDEVVKDKRLSSETRPALYQRMIKLAKAFKKK